MNITKEQNDTLSARIKISVEEADYKDRVKKELNKVRGKAQMPGFRQGHVPFGLIQRMYGQAVLVDEVNKILQESVGKFLEDEKINLLGAPFPAQDSPSIDFENDKQFDFTLDVVLAPEVNLDFLKTFPTTYYQIKATDAVIDEEITALRQRFGSMEESVLDAIQERDYLHCDCLSLENKDIQSDTYFFVDIKINPWASAFIGHMVNDTLEIDIDKAFEGDTEKAYKALNLSEENKSEAKGTFTFTVTKLNRRKEAEINEDFFKKAFPGKDIKTEKDLRNAIAEAHGEMCGETVDVWFFNDNFEPLIQKANLQYDDKILRRYMEYQKQAKRNEEDTEKSDEPGTVSDEEFEKIKKGTSWQLIQQKLMDTYGIKVEPDEIKQAAKEQISRYFGIDHRQADLQLGEYMKGLVDNVMKDKEQIQGLYTRVLDKKITQVLKENTQITIKEATWEEFMAIADGKKKETAAPKKGKTSAKETKPKAKKPSTAKQKKEENTEQQSLFE